MLYLEAYKDVKSTIKYGRDDLTVDMIINSLRSKSHELKNDKETRSNGEGLYVRGRSQHRQSNNQESNNSNGQGHKKKGKDKSRSKSKVKWRKCYNCGKLGHYIKDCYKLNNNSQKNKPPEQSNIATSSTETLGELYLVCDNEEPDICVNSVSSACHFDECRDVVFKEDELPCLKLTTEKSENNNPSNTDSEVEPDNIVISPTDQNHHDDSQPVDSNTLLNNNQIRNESQNLPQSSDLDDYHLAKDRDRRTTKVPSRFSDYDLAALAENSFDELCGNEPKTFDDAVNGSESVMWWNAMKDEMTSLYKNQTWELVPKPQHKSIVDCRWLYKLKKGNQSSDPPKFKARLVTKGFTQKYGIDYTEIFTPVVKYTTLRLMFALVAHSNLEMEQLDVKTAFLHGGLDDKIYMNQSISFVDKHKSDHVCLLKKSLYGLKQSPRQWNKRFDIFMLSL
ncbi:Reverse transcriptase Ty1/copia-type domain-containing protein [Abeliophyllum distichum]|uniref:Reverse transcriptase Ty1/copia-type domain-containing protein n=1 Tax=Abeliophyllum distichum TaxID=126358 RepID=A0ABD1U3Q5_9LAMI